MMWFILRRALWGVLVVMSVVTLVFFLIFVAGDPADLGEPRREVLPGLVDDDHRIRVLLQ